MTVKLRRVWVQNAWLLLPHVNGYAIVRGDTSKLLIIPPVLWKKNSLTSPKIQFVGTAVTKSLDTFFRKWHVFLFACLVSLWHSATQSVVLFLSLSPYHSPAEFSRAHPSLVSRRDFLASAFIRDKSVLYRRLTFQTEVRWKGWD